MVIVAGFQGQTTEGQITTLGRGGSDLTAIALAAALKADLCQIYTDVDGVYTADPRIVPGARKLDEISYDEMLELASLGAKVMQSRSVEFAKKFGVVFEVRSSLNDNPGTIVKEETKSMEGVVVRGVSLDKNQAKVTLVGVPDKPGVAARIFKASATPTINVDMIVQNISHGTGTPATDISFTVDKPDLLKAQKVIDGLKAEIGFARGHRRREHRQALHRGRRHEEPHRRRRQDVRDPGQRRREHRHDLHQRDQDLGGDRPGQRRSGHEGRPRGVYRVITPLTSLQTRGNAIRFSA